VLKDPFVKRIGPFRTNGKPMVDILLNGQRVVDWDSFRVELNGLGAVDNFQVGLPWEVTEFSPRDALLYSSPTSSSDIVTGAIDVVINAGFEGEGDLTPLIEGAMDRPVWDFSKRNGEIVVVYGRSRAAKPYDYKETVKFQNLTSTAAFKQIALFHGLNPVVPVETNSLIGQFQNEDHVSTSREVSHWDFVLYLAENEGFTTRLRGKDWFFGPHDKLPGYNLEPIAFTWGYNIEEPFRIERAPNAARNLIVEVISWIPGKKAGKGQKIIEKASFAGSSSGHKYVLRYYFSNLTRDQCQRKAQNILAEMSKNQIFGSFNTDWFQELSNDRKIALYGVGKGLSQVYFTPKIVITGNKTEGLLSEVSFTNLPLEEGGSLG
jgi:hypothetical protein